MTPPSGDCRVAATRTTVTAGASKSRTLEHTIAYRRRGREAARFVMSSSYVIVCRRCGSYRTERCRARDTQAGRYLCEACGDEFEVNDVANYAREHPPDLKRCSECDTKDSVQLIEKNHRYPMQPEGEVVDLHQCSRCGVRIHRIVQEGRYVLYD